MVASRAADGHLDRRFPDGDEGDDVEGPKARMHACMGSQVDSADRLTRELADVREEAARSGDQREDGPVMVGVAMDVGHRPDR